MILKIKVSDVKTNIIFLNEKMKTLLLFLNMNISLFIFESFLKEKADN